MLNGIATITPETLPLICWKSQPVITTEVLASLYGVQEKQIWQNFGNNKDRFTEGKHHYKLTGSELKEFKNCIENFEAVKIAPRTPNLMLWTERGAVRHAKMLGTDKAWEVQEKLEDCYFSRQETHTPVRPLSHQPTALDVADWVLGKLPNLGERSRQEIVSRTANQIVGFEMLPLPKVEEKSWTAGELAEEFGCTANKIGRLANAHGLKTEEFGEHRLSKSRYSTKQVEQFYYNEKGRAAITAALEG